MKVYLAGPDVFFPDAREQGAALVALCARYGFTGLFPLDNAPPPSASSPLVQAHHIFEANVALIRGCDAVMANLQAFRGFEPDSGTAFEVGFAAALGLPVWGYRVPDKAIVEQVPGERHGDRLVDTDGNTIEDFGMPRNLMLACSSRLIAGDAQTCLAAMQRHYGHAGTASAALGPVRE